jgi:hypothetical protein
MRRNKPKSKFRSRYSRIVQRLLCFKHKQEPNDEIRVVQWNYWKSLKTNKTPFMLPLKLSITGLYSYQKNKTIDFEELTRVYSILSGSVPEILCFRSYWFCLVWETERLNSRDKRSYNMLNLKSDRANIEFEF